MNLEVPNLYENLNINTLPKIIKEEFYKLGHWMYSFEDVFFKPYFRVYEFNLDDEKIKFYAHENAENDIYNHIKNKQLLNENYDTITINDFHQEYLKEYGKGFYKGYINYSNELKNKGNQIFEPDNKQIAHKVFSKVIKERWYKIIEIFPFTFIPMQDKEQVKKKYNSNLDFYYLTKKKYKEAGFKSGEKYKAWELILHNPTLFEDIFIEQLSKPEPKEEPFTKTPDLNLKNIPKFNLQQRFYLFQKLNFDNGIHQIETELQKSKHKVLALIIGISLDNAKHLLNGTYKDLTPEQKEEVEEYLLLQKVKL